LVRSFRDPSGFVFQAAGRFLRAVQPSAFQTLTSFLETGTARRLTESGRFIRTAPLSEAETSALLSTGELSPFRELLAGYKLVEHERIAFPSFPEEWPPEMLHAAGALTIDLALEALREGFVLKDASPYNVLFRGPKPVFVDALSVAGRETLEIVWRPYAQFVRTFLLPLEADRHGLRSSHNAFATSREGLEPQALYDALPVWRRLMPPWLGLVSAPVWLSGRKGDGLYRPKQTGGEETARFVVGRLLRGLDRKLSRAAPRENRISVWSGYQDACASYRKEHFQVKVSFVETALRDCRPARVLDAGCNTGTFSELAARLGAEVVAFDSDAASVGALWRRANEASLAILPLVVDLARPTPSSGWRNQECPAFLERARGGFDMLLLLAVLHHLLITSRIPLAEILSLSAELTSQWLIVEWVEPADPMFQRLTRGRQNLYAHLTSQYFESVAVESFQIVKRHAIEGAHRILYLLRRKA
jgi:SAM-dependent methyltransferase